MPLGRSGGRAFAGEPEAFFEPLADACRNGGQARSGSWRLAVAARAGTVEEYHRMAEAGLLGRDERVELVEGEVIDMAHIGSRHTACVDRLTELLVTRLAGRAVVRVQNPVRLGDLSEPQPDLAVLRDRPDFYAAAHPGPGDVRQARRGESLQIAGITVEVDEILG